MNLKKLIAALLVLCMLLACTACGSNPPAPTAALSVPEGDDKPAKYPLVYQTSDVMVINKIDTMPAFDFSRERVEKYVRESNPGIRMFYVSAKTGEGVKELAEYLINYVKEWNGNE